MADTATKTFTKGNTRYKITAELRPIQGPRTTIDLEPAPADAQTLSITAEIYEKRGPTWECEGGGQPIDELRQAFPDSPEVERLCHIWEHWHLNDTRPGCRVQREAIQGWEKRHGERLTNYTDCVEVLAIELLLEVPIPGSTQLLDPPPPYRYGSQWLLEPLPHGLWNELKALLAGGEPFHPDVENESAWVALGVRMEAQKVKENPHQPDNHDADHWKLLLRRTGQVRARMTIYFSMGSGYNGQEPTIDQVMKCLADDACTMENCGENFEEFCSNLGFDSDSRQAEKTFKATLHQTRRLKTFLGDDYQAILRPEEVSA